MKKPIEWHEECQKNSIGYYAAKRRAAQLDITACDLGDVNNAFRQRQIDEAKRRGMSGFDADKFLHKKARKTA